MLLPSLTVWFYPIRHFSPYGICQNESVQPYPRTWVEVDLGRLKANLEAIRGTIGQETKLAFVVKADAYGHGLVPVGRAALRSEADALAVATVQEGIALRDAGVDAPILVMSPILPVEAEQAVFYRLEVFLESVEMARHLSEAAERQQREARIHLKVDTGLHRFGCQPHEAVAVLKQITTLPGIAVAGVGQHFADSAQDLAGTEAQMRTFFGVVQAITDAGLPTGQIHLANSAAATRIAESRQSLVRVGIFAYGIDPFGLRSGDIEPVMTWNARVTSIRHLPAGERLSYSGTYTTRRPSCIATLGVGYGDGYPRSLSNRGDVLLNGTRCPVVGLVCMDQLLIDATDTDVNLGDTAELLGRTIGADHIAALCDTNAHEIVTRIMSRVPRRYIDPG